MAKTWRGNTTRRICGAPILDVLDIPIIGATSFIGDIRWVRKPTQSFYIHWR